MNVADALRAIAQGRRTPDLLHTCRLDGPALSAYGEEAVLAALRAPPLALDRAEVLTGSRHAALFGADAALFAEHHDGRIARLWRTGARQVGRPEPETPVAFDPDLAQARGAVFLRAEDHPELDPAVLSLVEAAGRDIVEAGQALRTRAFAIRAFTAGGAGAALFAVYRLSAGQAPSFDYRIVRLGAP